MSKINIPKIVRPGFWVIAKLDQQQMQSVVDIIKNTYLTYNTEGLYDELTQVLNPKDTNEALKAILSFSELMTGDNTSESLSNNLTQSFIELEELEGEDSVFNLKDNLHLLLSNFKNIQLITLLRKHFYEQENPFIDVTTFTDIRFVHDSVDSKEYFLIVHKLNIEYKESVNDKTFNLTLDLNDLEKLKEKIEESINSEKLLRETYREILNLV